MGRVGFVVLFQLYLTCRLLPMGERISLLVSGPFPCCFLCMGSSCPASAVGVVGVRVVFRPSPLPTVRDARALCCAGPWCSPPLSLRIPSRRSGFPFEIGRASCRE